MSAPVDARLQRLRSELDDHTRLAERLGLDLERPLRSLSDGYPENAIALVGKLTERLLKQLWQYHGIEGDPSGRMLSDLIKRCRPFIRSSTVLDALGDIQRLRNRSTHDGYEIAEEDGLLAVRRLVDVLAWFSNTGSPALLDNEPHLRSEVARHSEFLAGLYVTLGYRLAKRFVLSSDTAYQLFCRESGVRLEYVELMLSKDASELRAVLGSANGELLRTRLPKLTRFVILDDDADRLADLLGRDYRVVRYDRFIELLLDLDAHVAACSSALPALPTHWEPASAAVLRTDPATGDPRLEESRDAAALLAELAQEPANIVVVGRPGSGKSTLLRELVAGAETGQRFRFYFDLSLKPRQDTFPEYVARLLGPCMRQDRSRAYDLFLYLIRSGSALCVLDAVDEGVPEASPAGFVELFADLSAVLSAESTVVMSSRVSFLADSPQIRQLLDRSAARSEQLVEQMYANGIDPERLPHFHLIRLAEPLEPDGSAPATALERHLRAELTAGTHPESLDALVATHIQQVLAYAGLSQLGERLPEVFGGAFLEGRSVFSLLDLHRALPPEAFTVPTADHPDGFALAPLFRPAGPEQLAFVHSTYQELLAARYLATPAGRAAAAGLDDGAFLTEQVRAFLARIPEAAESTDDCVLPAGVYLVGPAERLLLRTIARPVRFDRDAVTVARYRRFLQQLRPDGTSAWDHPDQPAHITHRPWTERLRHPDYYDNPQFDDYPAICVNWWSVYAFAASEGKRLPTATEWEAAARGTDGRLFPWGEDPDAAPVNCADTWVGRPLTTFQACRRAFLDGSLRDAHATPDAERAANRSPYGISDMVGNIWEWTSTTLNDPGEAVICGGSYDNPMRAIQSSSKGIYRKRGGSNAVGFRCVQDL